MVSRFASQNKAQAMPDEPPRGASSADDSHVPPDPLAPLLAKFAELREYAAYWAAAKADRWRVGMRNMMFYAVTLSIAAVIGMAALATAGVALVVGLINGLTMLLDGRLWLAQILVGSGIMIIALGAVYWWTYRQIGLLRSKVIKNYEQRKQQERSTYGTDVSQRAHNHVQH